MTEVEPGLKRRLTAVWESFKGIGSGRRSIVAAHNPDGVLEDVLMHTRYYPHSKISHLFWNLFALTMSPAHSFSRLPALRMMPTDNASHSLTLISHGRHP